MIDQEIYFKGKDIVIASNIHRIFPKELLLYTLLIKKNQRFNKDSL